jgi:hypothetical protein
MRAPKVLCIFLPIAVLAAYATGTRGQVTANWVTQLRPIEMGTTGGNLKDNYNHPAACCSGTLGALVEDDSGNYYVLSCNHVLARQNHAGRGSIITQPGLVDAECTLGKSNAVAKLTAFVPLKRRNMVDAALALITSTNDVDVTGPIIAIGQTSTNTFVPPLGSTVAKSGRTTGYTIGTVAAVDATLTVAYTPCNRPTMKPAMRTFTNQVIVTPPSFGGFNFGGEGDSGSLVVEYNPDITGGTTNVAGGVTNIVGVSTNIVGGTTNVVGGVTNEFPRVVGILFAGSSQATAVNPIAPSLAQLSKRLGGASLHMVGSTNAPAPARASAREESYGLTVESYKKASAIKSATETDLLKIPGVVGVGIGKQTGDNTQAAVDVFVDQDTPELRGILPTSIDGLPVQIIETGTFVAR